MFNSNLDITNIVSEAWRLVANHKWPIWAIAIFIGIVSFAVQFLLGWGLHIDPQNPPNTFRYLVMPLVNNIFIAPFFGGAMMVAVLCARGQAVSAKTGFQYLNKTISLMVTLFLIALFANILPYIVHMPWLTTRYVHIGWLNIVATLIAIFVYLFFFISVPLLVDKNKSPWDALVSSFQIIKHHWFKVLLLLILIYIFFIIAITPLYIGAMIHPYAKFLGAIITVVLLVWLVPFLFLIQGVLYHKLVD